MRKSLIAAGVALAVLAVPTEASAKGAAGLTISGAGVATDVLVYDAINRIAERSRLYESIWEESNVKAFSLTKWAPSDDLGPRLTLSWDMDHDGAMPGPDVPFVQSLYPFAPGGPLVHTADGQQIYLEPVEGGWHRAERGLLAALRDVGATPRSPERGTWFST
jgi:hypothetical protein